MPQCCRLCATASAAVNLIFESSLICNSHTQLERVRKREKEFEREWERNTAVYRLATCLASNATAAATTPPTSAHPLTVSLSPPLSLAISVAATRRVAVAALGHFV